MFTLYVFAGLIVAGVLFGAWRSRRGSSQDIPNPFRPNSRR